VRAGRLCRETDNAVWQFSPGVFRYYNKLWGPNSVDRFASFNNKQLPRYKAKWRDRKAEAVDSIHLSNRDRSQENIWCNPLWSLLDDLTTKLRQSNTGPTFIAPKWPRFPWFANLSELASETVEMPPLQEPLLPATA
jgi:hypothetical protein